MTYDPLTMDPVLLAVRRGNYIKQEKPMLVTLDRRADGAGGREVKFQLVIQPIDATHTHGEIERADKPALMAALAKAADEIVAILRQVPPKPS